MATKAELELQLGHERRAAARESRRRRQLPVTSRTSSPRPAKNSPGALQPPVNRSASSPRRLASGELLRTDTSLLNNQVDRDK
jgi:hypothetical protein